MDTSFFERYYKYFLWNEGLVDYYLSDKKGKDDIKLYVDAAVLARIGRKVEVGNYDEEFEYVEDFLESVENFCNYYNQYDNYYRCPLPLKEQPNKKNGCNGDKDELLKYAKKRCNCSKANSSKECKYPNKFCASMQCFERKETKEDGSEIVHFDFARPDFLAVAKHIACKECNECKEEEANYLEKCKEEKGIAYYHKDRSNSVVLDKDHKAKRFDLPFFAIVIYIILRFDEQEILKWENLKDRKYEKEFKEEGRKESRVYYLKIASGSRTYIKDLWQKIYNYNNRFDKDASIFERDEQQRNDYVGRIRYHIPLSSPLRRRIYDAIYMSGIWSNYDTMSFREQLSRIAEQISENKRDELSRIFNECLRSEEYKNIYKNRIQDLLDNFDIDIYREGLEQREEQRKELQTIAKGEFILALYSPSPESDEKPEVLLYTTIPEKMKVGVYEISERTGDFDVPVKIKGSTSVEIKDHTISERGKVRIRAKYKHYDVVFFYTRDNDDEDQLYFQTEELVPAKSYYVAVKDDEAVKQKFEDWCRENKNNPIKINKEYTKGLYGVQWIIYYLKGNWNGQYYQVNVEQTADVQGSLEEQVELRKSRFINKDGTYFINSLPYFEIPTKYDIDKIKVYLNFDIHESCRPAKDNEYQILKSGRKLIIDLLDVSNLSADFRCFVGLEYENKNIFKCDFKVCGQDIKYQQEDLCKYNKLGQGIEGEKAVVSGNIFSENSGKEAEGGYIITGLAELKEVPANAYFVNLLSAICYDKEYAEVRPDDFERCFKYAKTRLENDENISLKDLENTIVTAGFINIDYSKSPKRYQIVPPAFTRVPFAYNNTGGKAHQLYLLTGAFTRKFLYDLINYCTENAIGIYYKNPPMGMGALVNLVPPTILLEHNFKPVDFLKKYPHQCDVFDKQDLAYSLLNNVVHARDVFRSFEFSKYDHPDFLNHMQDAKVDKFPRLRSDKNSKYRRNWYIEKEDNAFCKVDVSMLDWAYLYCYLSQFKTLMVIDQNQRNAIYLPHSLRLPWMVRRALYMMNIGYPETEKVFITSNNSDIPYQRMDKYVLTSEDRVKLVTSILSEDDDHVRDSVRKDDFKMYFWTPKQKYAKSYLVLKEKIKDTPKNNGPKVVGRLKSNGEVSYIQSKNMEEEDVEEQDLKKKDNNYIIRAIACKDNDYSTWEVFIRD